MAKVKVNDLTKAELADYVMNHFGQTINRKKGRQEVIRQFKKAEKEWLYEQKIREDGKQKTNDKKKKDHEALIEKRTAEAKKGKTEYPVVIGEKGSEMYRPTSTGICLGDPPIKVELDGEKVTNSMPHLDRRRHAEEETD